MSCSACPNQLGDEFANAGVADTLEEVLANGNITGPHDIQVSAGRSINASASGATVLTRTLYTESIAPLTFPIGTEIGILGGLAFPGDMNLRNNANAGGTAVKIDSIPAAPSAQANVVSYDPTSKNLYYQSASTGTVTSVSAGTNISVTGTASAPIVNLRAPLTSQLDVGSQNITSSTGNININAPSGNVIVEGLSISNTNIQPTTTGSDIVLRGSINNNAQVVAQGTGGVNLISANQISATSLGSGSTAMSFYSAGGGISLNSTQGINIVGGGDILLQPNSGRVFVSTPNATPMTITGTGAGGQANPTVSLVNTNATGPVAMEVYKNKPTAGTDGDVLFNQSVYGKDSTNAKSEFTRITHTIRDRTAGIEDGSMEFNCFVNGTVNTFLQLNGNENEVNVLKTLDMTTNNVINIAKIGVTNPGPTTGLAGQALCSGGASNAFYNYKMTGTAFASLGSISINATTQTDILGNIGVLLTQGSFCLSPINKYRITVCGSFTGVNDIVFLGLAVANGANIVACDTFATTSDPYTVENKSHAGSFYTSYTVVDTVNMATFPFSYGQTASIYCYALCATGSHTINNNRYNVSIEPVYT
jgi:hypothetical protein